MLYRKFLREKKQLSNVLSEFVIFLKLGVLWWKLKIFIVNFSHVSPNRFWRIFSMLLQSHPTIKWRWKKLCCNYFDAKPQFDWTIIFSRSLTSRHTPLSERLEQAKAMGGISPSSITHTTWPLIIFTVKLSNWKLFN